MNNDCKAPETTVQNVPLTSIKSAIVEVPLTQIDWQNLTTQLRVAIDGDQIDNLKAAFEAGATLPPIDLFRERADAYIIADGWHRYHAARILKHKTINAYIHDGGRSDAIKFALGANATHGLRRTNKDKRKAVEVAVREFPKLSARAIADLCHVSHNFAAEIVKELSPDDSSRVGKDGKTRRQPVRDPRQMDFFERLSPEWRVAEKNFDLTVNSTLFLDERVPVTEKLEAVRAMRAKLDDFRRQLAAREKALLKSAGQPDSATPSDLDPLVLPDGDETMNKGAAE